jgi:hypothetical protein
VETPPLGQVMARKMPLAVDADSDMAESIK